MKRIASLASALVATFTGAGAEEPPRFSVQSTSDFASYGAFYTDLTALYSPFGNLWEPGWRVEGIASARRYSMIDSGHKRIGLDATVDVLAGYQFMANGWSLLVAAGMTVVDSHLYAARNLPSSNTMLYGAKVLGSLYGKPTDDTMVYLQAHYNTASEFYYVQGKTGLAIAPNLFVGPEAAFSGSWTYDQLRLGAHVTGVTFAGFSSGISLGFVRDSNYGEGLYLGANLQANF
ncbi:MAG: cellulose biosynthesis protein BcsS [Bradyrhizobium sp.]|uniref:cellulose biosynthesis protein BcsS n=1 Tax=Bradyrhizobium sp. TaxID=376 RepID=UPI0025B8E126|nr:cellulose biosynthesis protein BcsS [Bradyrhizobium sp.]MBI5262557.1 cellulose biosynthesis protein BcsS [Bradyrhizobium sp.]